MKYSSLLYVKRFGKQFIRCTPHFNVQGQILITRKKRISENDFFVCTTTRRLSKLHDYNSGVMFKKVIDLPGQPHRPESLQYVYTRKRGNAQYTTIRSKGSYDIANIGDNTTFMTNHNKKIIYLISDNISIIFYVMLCCM